MKSFSRYTPLKLLVSYLLLLGLMSSTVWFLFKQQSNLNKSLKVDEKTNSKQLAYAELIRDLYEADNYAKVAIRKGDKVSQRDFISKNKEIITYIDSLKTSVLDSEQGLLDTIKQYLSVKEHNIVELRRLQNTRATSPIGEALQGIKNLEQEKGKLTLENFVQNLDELTDYQRRVAQEYVDYLNANVPRDPSNSISHQEADSLLTASKTILETAQKKKDEKSILIKTKEIQLLQNELAITQKLSNVINQLRESIELEQLKFQKAKLDNQNKSFVLLQKAALACAIVVVFFFFLLSVDFFKNKVYREKLEIEKQKTEQLLESREQLMTTVSHDIKAPLQSLLGYSEQLLEREHEFANREQLIKIKSATNYIQQLVSSLLDYVRMEKGKIQVIHTQFDLNELIEESAQNIADLSQKDKVSLVFKLSQTEGFFIYSDYNKLRQILYNLIGNAFKFTQEGSVTIETQKTNDTVTLMVKDTGIGISKEAYETIFKPFTQENNQVEILYGGTGLGLSICKRLVGLLDGTISVESKINEGATFLVKIPLLKPDLTKKPKQIALDVAFLIDDDVSQLKLNQSLLKPHFKEVYTFSDANEALRFGKTKRPSIVVTDIQMPLLDGYAFLAQFRQTKENQLIPVIATSGNYLSEELYQSSSRFDYFLPKPFGAKELLGIIATLAHKEHLETHEEPKDLKEVLVRFLGDDKELVHQFLEQYLTEFKSDNEKLNTAIQDKNAEQVAQACHKMATMIHQLQEITLANQLKTIEKQLLKNPEMDDFKKPLENLKQQLADFEQKIKLLYQNS